LVTVQKARENNQVFQGLLETGSELIKRQRHKA
jgi:hypothetical protein